MKLSAFAKLRGPLLLCSGNQDLLGEADFGKNVEANEDPRALELEISFGRSPFRNWKMQTCPQSQGRHHRPSYDPVSRWSLVDLDPSMGQAKPKIRIGSYCSILHDFQCNASLSVEVQDYVLIAPRVFITDSDHVVDEAGERTTLCNAFRSAAVVIEHDCWLGVNAVVLKGVRIGHHSTVGANAVVTRDVPPFSTVVGAPAKVIGQTRSQ